jgi:hypothetical protein
MSPIIITNLCLSWKNSYVRTHFILGKNFTVSSNLGSNPYISVCSAHWICIDLRVLKRYHRNVIDWFLYTFIVIIRRLQLESITLLRKHYSINNFYVLMLTIINRILYRFNVLDYFYIHVVFDLVMDLWKVK